jgi:Predicted nucleotide-binding protein containing TIR-like domain
MRSRIFIGSSTESLPAAETLQVLLSEKFEVHIWNFAFEAGQIILDQLLEAKASFQYAIFIFGPDDIATIRHEKALVTRDNVVFEAGLFMSHLGRERTFIVVPDMPKTATEAPKLHLLSDFRGLIYLTYHPPLTFTSPNWNASLGPVSIQIIRRIATIPLSGRVLALPGRWIGKINQDANPNWPATEYDWDSNLESDGKYIVGKFTLQVASPGVAIEGWPKVLEFNARGTFVHERFLKMEYDYIDATAIQLGLLLLELNNQSTKMRGRFLGFGALSQQLTSGSVNLEKRHPSRPRA